MTAAPGVVTKALPFCAACQGLQQQEDGDVELPMYLWDFVAAHGLVHRTVQCPWCQSSAYLYRHSRFRCQKVMTTFIDHRLVTKRCNFDISALKGTFFDHSNLPLKKILCLCYWFVVDTATYNEVMGKVNVPLYRLIYWYTLCQELIINYCLNHCRKIGGPGKTVKITEARLREKKYYRPSKKGQWVLGGFEEESGSFFLIPIPNRKKETLAECIREWILPGTEIISDFWEKCASLSIEGYTQKTVHHPASRGIPENSATLKNAEQQPQGSCQSDGINTWLEEPFVGRLTLTYFKLTFPEVLERFHQLLVLAAELYPPQKGKQFGRIGMLFIVLFLTALLNLLTACLPRSCSPAAHDFLLLLIPILSKFLMQELTTIFVLSSLLLVNCGTTFLCLYFLLLMT